MGSRARRNYAGVRLQTIDFEDVAITPRTEYLVRALCAARSRGGQGDAGEGGRPTHARARGEGGTN